MNGKDDGTVHITLGHSFPYYGGVFTDAWMSSNGFIILYDPVNNYGNPNTSQSYCRSCGWGYSGGPPDGKSNLSYMIAPLWSDFKHVKSVPNSGYFYETDTDGTWFEWRNVKEFGTNNLNTFGLQLYPEGSFDFHYSQVKVTRHDTWIGFTGDATSQSGNVYDEVNQLFYKQNSMTTNDVTNFTNATTNFGYVWWGQDGGYQSTGPDCSNPLNDTQCDGYAVAWLNDQCDNDPLFSESCSGYSTALIQNGSGDPGGPEEFVEESNVFSSDPNNSDQFFQEPPAFEEEPQFTPIQATLSEPTLFEDQDTFTEPMRVEEEPFVEEEMFEDPTPPPLKIEEISGKELTEEISKVEFLVEASVVEVILEDAAVTTYSVKDPFSDELLNDNRSSVSYDHINQMQHSGLLESSDVENVSDTEQVSSVIAHQQDDTSLVFEQETFSTTGDMFDSQVSEAFSAGANISVVLSGARPDFSKYDVKPPTKQQRVATKKVESLAEKMSESTIQQNLNQIQENVQESGGFEDQTVSVVLINHVPGFDQYSTKSLKSQNDWYRSKSIYKSNGNVDNTMTLYRMAGQTEQKHKQMVLEQYGR
jgi:hypothetical protein